LVVFLYFLEKYLKESFIQVICLMFKQKQVNFINPQERKLRKAIPLQYFHLAKKKNSYDTGKIFYIDNSFYEGQLKNNKPNGSGKFLFADGSQYEGYVMNGFPHGRGTLTTKNNQSTINWDKTELSPGWAGRVPKQSNITFENGSTYNGALAQNYTITGFGIFHFQNGSVYEGYLVNGLMHGVGSLTLAGSELKISTTFINNYPQNPIITSTQPEPRKILERLNDPVIY